MRSQRTLLGTAVVLTLGLSACTSSTSSSESSSAAESAATAASTAASTPATAATADSADYCEGHEGGELTWSYNQEPGSMQWTDPANYFGITAWLHQGLLEGLYGVDSHSTYFPELLKDSAVLTEQADGSVVAQYTLRDGLTWSDGTPLTSDDVKFTYDVIMEGYDPATKEGGVLNFSDRSGYDSITDFTVTSPTEFSVTFDKFYAGHKALFSEVYPAHAFTGGAASVNEQMKEWTDIPSSGPLLYDSRQRGVSLTMKRNDAYHGSNSPDAHNLGAACVDTVKVVFVPDAATQINGLRAGEVDFTLAQAQPEMADLKTDERFAVASNPGPVSEHMGMNLLNKHLAKPEVREALAYALDKSAIVQALYEPLFGDILPAEGLGNTYWMSQQTPYVNNQTAYDGSQIDKATAALEAAGYTKGADGIYAHPVDGPLTLRLGTTGGDRLRELEEQLIQAQMKEAGIDITIDNLPGSTYFGEKVFSEEALKASASGGKEGDPTIWDLTIFGWTSGPWPGVQSQAYRSDSPVAVYGYNNKDFDAKAAECDATIDQDAQDQCYNELDAYVTTLGPDGRGLFMLPLSVKPMFYAYDREALDAVGVSPEELDGGPMSDVVDFRLK